MHAGEDPHVDAGEDAHADDGEGAQDVDELRLHGELGDDVHASMHSLKCSGNSGNSSCDSSNKKRET